MGALKNKFRVAVFDEFLDSFATLPRAQQKKVNKLMRQFRADPTAASINYEPISTFKDKNLRTVRVDQTYRAIVLQPEQGNIYAFLWVDHHDKAMAWAQNKRCVIHKETGSLQVLTRADEETPASAAQTALDTSGLGGQRTKTQRPETQKPEAQKPEASRPEARRPEASRPEASRPEAQAARKKPLFRGFSDDELLSVGVPPEHLARVREVMDKDDLDAAAAALPSEAYEALFFLADGETLREVRQYMGLEDKKAAVVDTEDFAAALETAGTMRHFALITDDQALEAMLDAPLERWRVFLHPSQRKLVSANFNGPARVLGGAGTGKTVVAMHRAKFLAETVFSGDSDRILFTTFTNNLARDITENLRKLCAPETLRRIQVVHLDKWVAEFLAGHGYDYRVAYWPQPQLKKLWEQALALRPDGFSETFFREEWDYVVQPSGCASYEDYRGVRRTGRGVRLSRSQRKAIWPVFEEYRNLLDEKRLRESEDAMRDAAGLLRKNKTRGAYRAIVVDESQDMSTVAFELLRKLIPVGQKNDLFIVGDGHQRIYRRKVVLKHAGVIVVGRSKKLYINYRTTDEIRRFAVALLRDVSVDDLDGGTDDNSKYKSLFHGQLPTVTRCKNFEQELDAIRAFIAAGEPSQTCLVARTNALVAQYAEALQQAGMATYALRRSEAEDRSAPGLRLATMHRVKGLEFDRLIIAGVNHGVVPLATGDTRSDDSAVREEAEQRERALFYVAVTRARRDALITSHGTPSPWLATPDADADRGNR